MAFFRTLKENCYRFKDRLSIWFSYWKPSKNMYDFDFSCVLEAEHHQLKRLIKCIDKWRSHENAERDIHWMKICDHLLNVILHDAHEDGKDFKLKHYCNTKNYKRFFPNMSDEMVNNLKYFPSDLYAEKAWKLYHCIREEHMREWWD